MTAPRPKSCPLTEQAVGWALHALEPDEEMAVLLHVPQCGFCQVAVRDTERVLANLGGAVEQVEPPPSLRGSLMAAAAETSQVSSSRRPSPMAAETTTPLTSLSELTTPLPARTVTPQPPVTPKLPVTPRPSEPSAPGRRWGALSWASGRRGRVLASSLALVSVLTVGGLATYTAQLQQQRDAEQAQAQGFADLLEELNRPGAKYALLAASPEAPTVAAVLVTGGERRLFTIGLEPSSSGRTVYVLWGLRDSTASPQPLGTFDVAAADQGVRTVGSGADTDDFALYAISLEDGTMAPAAPSSVLASGEVEL